MTHTDALVVTGPMQAAMDDQKLDPLGVGGADTERLTPSIHAVAILRGSGDLEAS